MIPASPRPDWFEAALGRSHARHPPAAPPVIVEGLVRRASWWVSAPSRRRKSWLGFNLALSRPSDGYLFGTLQVARKDRVLFFHGETPHWMAAERWRMLRAPLRGPTSPTSLPVGDPVREDNAYCSPHTRIEPQSTRRSRLAWTTVRALSRKAAPSHDHRSLGDFYAGDENNNDRPPPSNSSDSLRDHRHCGVISITRKGPGVRDAEDLWRGASSRRRAQHATHAATSLHPARG